MLKHEDLLEVLYYDQSTGIFTWKEARSGTAYKGSIAGTLDDCGYRLIKIYSKLYKAHRIAWFYVYGSWPTKQIDHINRKRDDNCINNLREVTQWQNRQNVKNPHPGLHWRESRGHWAVSIRVNKKLIHLGAFIDKKRAIEVRKAAEGKYYGGVLT